MKENTGSIFLDLQPMRPIIGSPDLPNEQSASLSTPNHLPDAYTNATRPVSGEHRPKDIYPREQVQATAASQRQDIQSDVGADSYYDIVRSSVERVSNTFNHLTGTPLHEDSRRASNSPFDIIHGSEHENVTWIVKEPSPELESKQRHHEDTSKIEANVMADELTDRVSQLLFSVDSPLEQPSLGMELLSATDATHSDTHVSVKKTMDSAPYTYHPLPLRPLLMSHGCADQTPSLAVGLSMPSSIPLDGKNLHFPWTYSHLNNKPVVGKVYYIPDGRNFPTSVIHTQKQQEGFFKHPVLVIGVDQDFAYFYALTKAPPAAIREMSMCLRMGGSAVDEGLYTLRLAHGSLPMQTETWTNLEQRFLIEWGNLNDWAIDVRINTDDLWKLWRRVQELEAQQNRFIYKPLPRDMSLLRPGTVVMLLNDLKSSTLGAPIVIVENQYPRLRYLRVKSFSENPHFNSTARRTTGSPRHLCLEICKYPKMGHDGTPAMLLESDSPQMREQSYVEVYSTSKTSTFDMCKTWCWPPVIIQPQSMAVLRDYIANHSASGMSTFMRYRSKSQTPSRSSSVGPMPPTPLFHNRVLNNQFGSVIYPSRLPRFGYQIAAGENVYPSPPHTPMKFRQPVPNSQNTGGYGCFGNPYSPSNVAYSVPTPSIYQNHPIIPFDRYGYPHSRI